MTYKNSNWTRGELGHDIERNPLMDCPECNESYRYQDYWQERDVEGKEWNPNKVKWLCDDCIEQAKQEYELHKKRREHSQLKEFTA